VLDPELLTVTIPEELLLMINCCPKTKVLVTGRSTFCVVLPVKDWIAALETVKVVVPAAVTVVANPLITLLADRLELASQPAKLEAVGAVVTDVTAVPPLAIGSAVPE
jgi:hypothetical protein